MRLWNSVDPRLRLVLLPLAVIGIAVVWYLGSPLFLNRTVDESFPQPAIATVSAPPVAAATPAPAVAAAAVPVLLASGEFGEIDAVHKGMGRALLYRLPEGGRVLRFEDFRVTNGPDLYVYLSAHPAPLDSRQLHDDSAFEVAVLKGNVGSQNYELPADLDLTRFKSVVIYCKRFSVVFSTAELI